MLGAYLLILGLLTACNGMPAQANSTPATDTTPSPPVAPMAASGASSPPAPTSVMPPGCTQMDVAALLAQFFDAFNRGDQVQLATFFADSSADFQWYSVTEGQEGEPFFRHVSMHSRADLPTYFQQRHAHGERLILRTVEIGPSWQYGQGDILYDLTRTADDLPPGFGGPEHIAFGKGAINCADQTIYVWSMAMNTTGSRNHAVRPGINQAKRTSGAVKLTLRVTIQPEGRAAVAARRRSVRGR